MTTEDTQAGETEHKIRLLQGNPCDRITALRGISLAPLPDRRLLALCEALLDDQTITLAGIPFTFGEVRWYAADAVAALRGALNISDPVVIPDAFAPVTAATAEGLLKAAGVEVKGGLEAVAEALGALAKLGRLPRQKITRTP